MESLSENWDGAGAAAPKLDTIKGARKFIRSLSSNSMIPRATLHADGHALLFVRDDDAYAEIEFIDQDRFGYYARQDGQEWGGEMIWFDGRALPEGLSRIGLST